MRLTFLEDNPLQVRFIRAIVVGMTHTGEGAPILKVVLAAFLFLHFAVHPFGHTLFAPVATLPLCGSSPDDTEERGQAESRDECRLCRSASSVVPALVPIAVPDRSDAGHWWPASTSLPRTLYSIRSLAPRAPPLA
jgi:hypothetical protein